MYQFAVIKSLRADFESKLGYVADSAIDSGLADIACYGEYICVTCLVTIITDI